MKSDISVILSPNFFQTPNFPVNSRLREIFQKVGYGKIEGNGNSGEHTRNAVWCLISVCHLLRSGVAAIFGPQSAHTASHVQSICDTMEIPHLETRWDYRLRRQSCLVNLYPHPTTLSKVRTNSRYNTLINAPSRAVSRRKSPHPFPPTACRLIVSFALEGRRTRVPIGLPSRVNWHSRAAITTR